MTQPFSSKFMARRDLVANMVVGATGRDPSNGLIAFVTHWLELNETMNIDLVTSFWNEATEDEQEQFGRIFGWTPPIDGEKHEVPPALIGCFEALVDATNAIMKGDD